jgi:hypothetical protein
LASAIASSMESTGVSTSTGPSSGSREMRSSPLAPVMTVGA